MSSPAIIYCCYHICDKESWENLKSHFTVLKRNGQIETFDYYDILPGTNPEHEHKARLGIANIVLLIISKYFIADDLCWNIMQQVMDKHQAGALKVIPILYRPVYYDSARFAELSMLPPGKPISLWDDPDEAYAFISQRIGELVEVLHKEREEINNDFQQSHSLIYEQSKQRSAKSSDKTRIFDVTQESLGL